MLKVTGKTFQKDGKWMKNPEKTRVLLCHCGNKYLKTRELQTECIRCLNKVQTK